MLMLMLDNISSSNQTIRYLLVFLHYLLCENARTFIEVSSIENICLLERIL